jgi:hypothetical protein
MKSRLARWIVAAGLIGLVGGCASKKVRIDDRVIAGYDSGGVPIYGEDVGFSRFEIHGASASFAQGVDADRMIAWRARITLETVELSNAVAQVTQMVGEINGIVESRSEERSKTVRLTLQIPAGEFHAAMERVGTFGEVTSCHVDREDVTEEHVDLDARIKNRNLLRDRLRELLDQAAEVKDILAIETELNRIQGDIDAMQARIQSLQGRVNFARVNLTIQHKEVPPQKILGPLGWIFKGVFWTVEKLFVIRE